MNNFVIEYFSGMWYVYNVFPNDIKLEVAKGDTIEQALTKASEVACKNFALQLSIVE